METPGVHASGRVTIVRSVKPMYSLLSECSHGQFGYARVSMHVLYTQVACTESWRESFKHDVIIQVAA